MTPEELQQRAKKVARLEDQLKIINDPESYLIVNQKGHGSIFIRTSQSNSIEPPTELKQLAEFIFETIRNKMIMDIENEIKELCNE